jgi:hypothetical protein
MSTRCSALKDCNMWTAAVDWQQDFLKAKAEGDIVQGIVVTAAQEVYVGLHSGTILR